MAIVLDTGALIAAERGDRVVIGALTLARDSEVDVRTSSAAVAQVWRGGSRQAGVTHALRGAEEVPLDRAMARRVGALLAQAAGLKLEVVPV